MKALVTYYDVQKDNISTVVVYGDNLIDALLEVPCVSDRIISFVRLSDSFKDLD